MKNHIRSSIAFLGIVLYLIMALACYENQVEYISECSFFPEPKNISQDYLIRVLDKETNKAIPNVEIVIISKKYNKVANGENCKVLGENQIINYVFTGQEGIAHFPIQKKYYSQDDFIKLHLEVKHASYHSQYYTELLIYNQSTAGKTFNLLKIEKYP